MTFDDRPPTLHDVARSANVSVATASRALGGYGRFSDQTRLRVQKVAHELGYRPNAIARSMVTGRTQTVGVVCADLSSPFFAEALRGISDHAKSCGLSMLIVNTDEDLQAEREAINLLRDKRVDGVIVAPADVQDTAHLTRFQEEGRPVVLLDRSSTDPDFDSVTIDDISAMADAIGDLLDNGHRRIGIVVELRAESEADWQALLSRQDLTRAQLNPSSRRLLGYIQAHRHRGIAVDPRLVARSGDTLVESARTAARRLLIEQRPTAAVSVDNTTSVGLFGAVRHLELDVPDALSVIAFDNLDWTTLVSPPLTVIEQPVYEIGTRAAQALVYRLTGERSGPGKELLLETRYVRRSSVRGL